LQRFYEVRLAVLQEQRDFRRDKAALDKDYGVKLESLTKKYSEKYGQTLNGFSTVSAPPKGGTSSSLPTASLIRSLVDQS
jgi:Fes/CIP4, and EFC/F-BAR homology domain